MKKLILMAFNLILVLGLLTGCMYDLSGSDNIDPNPDIDSPTPNPDPKPDPKPDKPVEKLKLYTGSISSMNTIITFSMYASNQSAANQVYNRVKSIYDAYDLVADDGWDSVFGQSYESELAKLNRDRQLKNPSKTLVDLLSFADLMVEETDGYFNPYLGELNHMWKKYMDGLGAMPSPGEMDYFTGIARKTKYRYADNTIFLDGEGKIDLGGVAKGYATEAVTAYLKAANVKNYLLNAGSSNIVVGENLDDNKFKVGISYVFEYPNEAPVMEIKNGTLHIDAKDTKLKVRSNAKLEYGHSLPKPKKDGDIYFILDTAEYFMAENGGYKLKGSLALTTIDVENIGVCTSSPGHQHKADDKTVHHLINPMTGRPSNYREAVTIVGLDSGRLDAYSTAIFSMDDEKAKSFINAKGLKGLMIKNNEVYFRSEGI